MCNLTQINHAIYLNHMIRDEKCEVGSKHADTMVFFFEILTYLFDFFRLFGSSE